ncbi:hypothetical protein [Propionivibrio sp.]|uniref:hypothetical protein n=1 Tax=Propionivibrio sp. TaxID=2212460 RepID=UPI00261B8A09|nr:hypothetical protein [Propionivibrio sp.]
MKEPSPTPLPDVTPPLGGPVKANLKQAVPIEFFACTWQSAQDEVRQQRDCDWWIYDWQNVDFYWLFGNNYWWIQPQPDHSPLARRYYDQVISELNNATSQAYSQCESRHYASQSEPEQGLRLTVSSRLNRGGVRRGSSTEPSGIEARLSVPFAAGTNPPPPTPCPMLRRELFSKPVDFSYVLHGPGGGNFRWEWRDQQAVTPDPYFELYGRTLKFSGSSGSQFLGSLHLIIDRLADLWVRFENRPIPGTVADRVDPAQPLSYQVSTGGGYFGIAAVIEVAHLESGQIWYQSVHGSSYSPGQMTTYSWWPSGWEQMSMDANGIIRHYNVDWFYWLNTIDPASIGLPTTGTYRMRYILLAYGYQTYSRSVSSSALGLSGDTRMSWKSIWLSQMPSLITYTPGMTDGIIPPFEVTYTRSPVLYPWPANGTGILFDAVFDMKNITTFRFVIKVGNTFDFAVGLVVQASGWQAWVHLEPGETKYLAGGVSISGMANWNAYPLHPQSPNYGWQGNWGSSYISMYNGQCSISFSLFLTAPNNPETTPANLPALKATQRWYWDLSSWGPQYEPEWGAIKKYAPDGRYDYEYVLQQYNLNAVAITSINRSITKPSYQPLINPATYFVTGYQTTMYDWISPWHKRPWPGYSGWGSLSAPIMINGEQRTWNGSQYVWVPVEAVSISLTRAMMQQVAAMLGVVEYVVMDGDDIRWFVPVTYSPPTYPESFSNVLWIDRFYTRGGALIDDAAMRSAFQTVIANNAASWSNYRNIVIHPSVRFGSFLDNGGFEVGDYLLGPNGDMVEVGSLADLGSVSTRFLYHVRPEFQ